MIFAKLKISKNGASTSSFHQHVNSHHNQLQTRNFNKKFSNFVTKKSQITNNNIHNHKKQQNLALSSSSTLIFQQNSVLTKKTRNYSTNEKNENEKTADYSLFDVKATNVTNNNTTNYNFETPSLQNINNATQQITGMTEEVVTATSKWYEFPLDGCQFVLDNLHSLGLPWWATILTTSFVVRTALLPINIRLLKINAKLQEIPKHIKTVKEDVIQKMGSGYFESRHEAALYEQFFIVDLYRQLKVNPFKPFLYAIIQAPVYTTLFFTLRRMSTSVPDFVSGGALWFTDLSIADSTYALPAIVTMLFVANVEVVQYFSKKAQILPFTKTQIFLKYLFRAIAVIMFPILLTQPSGVLLYWVANNSYSLMITSAIRTRAVQSFFGFPETVGLSIVTTELPSTRDAVFVPKNVTQAVDVDVNAEINNENNNNDNDNNDNDNEKNNQTRVMENKTNPNNENVIDVQVKDEKKEN